MMAGTAPNCEPTQDRRRGTAVVIGASISGLLAARTLSDHFDRTVIVERDTLSDQPELRKGTPQSVHSHGLLAQGTILLERFLPGLVKELRAEGAHYVDWVRNTLMMRSYGWGARPDSDLKLLMLSRPLLETVVRRRVAALPGVEILDGTRVNGLLPSSDGSAVAGVLTDASGPLERIAADLVVDAGGRGSRAPSWLRDLGYPAPDEIVIDAKWGYASRLYTAPEGFDPDFVLWVASPNAGSPDVARRTRGFAALHLEGDRRWLVTLSGCAGDIPPSDDAGFLDFVEAVPDYGAIADWIKNATPLSPIRTTRSTVNRLRKFETLERRPEGFVAIGDAVAAFNPVYGQGMTLAAKAAVELDAVLENFRQSGPLTGLADQFQKRIAETIGIAWMISTGADYKVEGVEGPPAPPEVSQFSEYVARVEALASEDERILVKFLETVQLTRSPDWLMEPELVTRIQDNWDRLGAIVTGARTSEEAPL